MTQKIQGVFEMFKNEVQELSRMFEHQRREPPLYACHPKYSGKAMWARQLQLRIKTQMDRLQSTYYLENHPGFKDANSEFTKLHSNLDDYQKKTYDDWVRTMDGNPAKRLDNSLISKVPIPEPSKDTRQDNSLISKQGDMLDNNFDRTLLRIFQEVHYWVKLAYMVPAQVCLCPPPSLSLSVCPQLIS